MLQVLAGSVLLSIIHASIPNHWLPLVALSRTNKWSRSETIGATAIAGFAHTSSTIIIGILVGLLGYKLAESFEWVTHYVAPTILVTMGLVYLVLGLRHHHHHHHHFNDAAKAKNTSKWAVIGSLSFAMFFSPCIEIEAYYFSIGSYGWTGILAVSVIYLVVTVTGMVILVDLGVRGSSKIKGRFMEHHEKTITGIVLILTGIAWYFIELGGHGH